MFGVPQRLILGALLFNIFLCDLFLIVKNIDIASSASDNTPCTTGNSAKTLFSALVIAKWKLTLISVTFYVAQIEKLV